MSWKAANRHNHMPLTKQNREKVNNYSVAERKRLLKRGIKRIEALATGKTKGLTEKEFIAGLCR
jgi:hypothetical protein